MITRIVSRIAMVAGLTLVWTAAAVGQTKTTVPGRTPWAPETLSTFSKLPVQDGGRIKPLDTFAQFTLLRFNGERECTTPWGETLRPMAWLMDTLFYPELAEQYKMFLVSDSDALDAVGIKHEGKSKYDRYAYIELYSGRQALFTKAEQYAHKDANSRTPEERQLIRLAVNMRDFEMLTHFLDFARTPLEIPKSPGMAKLFPNPDTVTYADVLDKAGVLLGVMGELERGAGNFPAATRSAEQASIKDLLGQVDQWGSMASELALFPPSGSAKANPVWLAPSDVIDKTFQGDAGLTQQVSWFGDLEKLAKERNDRIAFRNTLAHMSHGIVAAAKARGEYRRIPLEVFLYKSEFLYYSLCLFVLGFVLAAISWLAPRNRSVGKALGVLPWLAAVSGLALLITVIVLRCIIRGRPPVSTLYETILFITAVSVFVALVMEFINRQRIALGLSTILGSLGLFLAYRYEVQQGTDTMPKLVAVLNTNFWLATHVTTVTIGYSAGLLAAAIAHVYVIGQFFGSLRERFFGVREGSNAFYRSITRMVYGTLCFGLVFSTLGTVLGGIWANYSWGRFWGWDPKENGALMIVLWELAVLHGRLGHYIEDFGINMSAVFGGMIVAFSWFGVNLLGVGLHSYGFTKGIYNSLVLFYGIEIVVLLLGTFVWFMKHFWTAPPPPPAGSKGKQLPASADSKALRS